jgi:hypothetical protein
VGLVWIFRERPKDAGVSAPRQYRWYLQGLYA